MSEEVYLIHYGVSGMKWGIRKKQEELVELQENLKKKKAEQAAHYKSDEYKKSSSDSKKQTRVNNNASNQKEIASIKAKQEEIKELLKQLNEINAEKALRQRNLQRQRQKVALMMQKHGLKRPRIV